MAKKFFLNILDPNSIEKLANDLEEYANNLPSKVERFLEKLADVGIRVGYQHMLYGSWYVQFEKTVTTSDGIVECVIVGSDKMPVHVVWDEGEADVSALLMSEFGSGRYADAEHKGTFPSKTAKANVKRGVWYWHENGVKISSQGEAPTRPMFHIAEEMRNQIQAIAIEVFK